LKPNIIDTGPIVAFLNRNDAHHRWALDIFDTLIPPLVTCESVMSEACFLLGKIKGGPDAALALLDRGLIEPTFDLGSELAPVRKLMRRYASVPMSLADACLVRMSEIHPRGAVVTIDEDFSIYRRNGHQVIPTLMPN
jgi:predicted nucleic acid-binding protein